MKPNAAIVITEAMGRFMRAIRRIRKKRKPRAPGPGAGGRALPAYCQLRENARANVGTTVEEEAVTMMIRKLSGLAVLASTFLLATQGVADTSKTVDARLEKLDVAEGHVRATVLGGTNQQVFPGDKGFLTKDGSKIENSDFEVDRVDDRLSFAKTTFSKLDELPARTSLVAHITTTRKCPRGGKRPDLFEAAVAQGKEPAEGFAFAKVTSTAIEHKSQISFTIDKGADDGVMPTSSTYALKDGAPRPVSGYSGITWVAAKTAGGTVSAGDAQELAKNVKRIGYERITCR